MTPTSPPAPLLKERGVVGTAVGTLITNEGKVVFHDVTRYGLHRLCVAVQGKYPDVEVWMEMLSAVSVKSIRYTEKVTVGHVFIGYLWFYFKEEG